MFRVQGQKLWIPGSGFRCLGSGVGFQVPGSKFWSIRFTIQSCGFRDQGLTAKVAGSRLHLKGEARTGYKGTEGIENSHREGFLIIFFEHLFHMVPGQKDAQMLRIDAQKTS